MDLFEEVFGFVEEEEKDFVESMLEDVKNQSETIPPIKWWQSKFDVMKEITQI